MTTTSVTTLNIALPKAISSAFSADLNDDLSSGVIAGFGILSYRGKVWRVKHKGVETVVNNAEGDPAASISVVLLKANSTLSKVYYADAYVEGDDTSPTCASANGVTPDSGIENPQCSQCDVCPQNVWGSKITPQGTETKACSDSRRIAIVPAQDMKNESCGGPMLLRVPAASLSTLAAYSDELKQANAPYYGVITKVGFDPDASYPKMVFTALRGITDSEAPVVLAQRDSAVTHRILEESATSNATPEPKAEPVVEEPVVEEPVVEEPVKKARKTRKKPVVEAVPDEPPVQEEADNGADAEELDIDALVSGLLGGSD